MKIIKKEVKDLEIGDVLIFNIKEFDNNSDIGFVGGYLKLKKTAVANIILFEIDDIDKFFHNDISDAERDNDDEYDENTEILCEKYGEDIEIYNLDDYCSIRFENNRHMIVEIIEN